VIGARAWVGAGLLLAGCPDPPLDAPPTLPPPPSLPTGERSIDRLASLLLGPGPEADFGAALAAADLDGDGRLELAVGAPGRDAVAVYSALDQAPRWIEGPPGSRYGAALAAGDVDGDGVDELLVGAPEHGDRDEGGPEATGLARGAVFVEGAGGRIATLLGAAAGDCLGAAVAAGDVDGDGLADALIGSPCRGSFRYTDPSLDLSILGQGAGAAWLVLAPRADGGVADLAAATFPGVGDFDRAGSAVLVVDLDGDGTDEPVVGAPDYFGAQWVNAEARGHARAWPGEARGELRAGDAVLAVQGGCCGADRFDETGASLAAADLDGDGLPELLVGAPAARDFGLLGGAWLLPGPALGELQGLGGTVLAAPPEDQGESGADIGRALAAGFDLDADGIPELAVGGPEDPRSADGGGIVVIREGLPSGFTDLFEGSTVLLATASQQALGSAFAWGDFDGDGRDELAVGAPGDRSAGHAAGGVFIVRASGAND
jgi:hypothetical protein